MPLTWLDDAYWEHHGIVFRMTDGRKHVVCRVGHEALQDYARQFSFEGTDSEIFEAYRGVVERAASSAHDAGASFDHQGRMLVTLDALNKATAS